MTSDIAIRAEGLSKRYLLGTSGSAHDSLRDLIAAGARTLMRRNGALNRSRRSEFYALRDASFEIARGENVGIIGANGAGKSTLLKVLSRIVEPTSGQATIAGSVGALLEVGTGFHGELTGRENTFLYGSILGMSHREIAAKFDAIVDFAEIAQFIDTPVKRYSSGMYVRLAFSVAAHLRPDILLLDEVLAVGDLAFQQKCMKFARELQQQDTTILFVSHSMFSIKSMCDRVIYIRAGRVEYDGPTDAGIGMYEKGVKLSVAPWLSSRTDDWSIILTDVELSGEDGIAKTVFDFGERLVIRMKYNARERIKSPTFMIAFVRSDGVACTVYSNDMDGFDVGSADGDGTVEMRTPPLKLVAERYVIHILVREHGTNALLGAQVGGTFHVRHTVLEPSSYGVFHERGEWKVLENRPEITPQSLEHGA